MTTTEPTIAFGDFFRDGYMECPAIDDEGRKCVIVRSNHPGPHRFQVGMKVVGSPVVIDDDD